MERLNSRIKHYKKMYFMLMESNIEDGYEYERGSNLKKKYSGGRGIVYSREGYNSSIENQWMWFRYYNRFEGIDKLDGYGEEYIFLKGNSTYLELIETIEDLNNGKRFWYNKFYHTLIKELCKKNVSSKLYDLECLDYDYYIDFKRNRDTKKIEYKIYKNIIVGDLIDINTNKKIEKDKRDKKVFIDFFNDRNSIMNLCSEWYDISSKWIGNKVIYKKMKKDNYIEFLEMIMFWGYDYDNETNTLNETYHNFVKKIYSEYCDWNDYDNMKSHIIINYRNKNRMDELLDKFKEEFDKWDRLCGY